MRGKGFKSYLRLLGLAPLLVAGSMSAGASQPLTWTQQSLVSGSVSSVYLFSVSYVNGLYMALGRANGGAIIMTSPDGTTWSTAYNDTTGFVSVDSVAYGNGLYVAVGDSFSGPSAVVASIGYALTSTDGEHWTVVNSSLGALSSGVVFGNGMFVVLAQSCQDISGHCTGSYSLTSTDGVHWTAPSPQDFPQPDLNLGGSAGPLSYPLGFINGQFLTLAGDAPTGITATSVRTSSDAANWTLSAAFGSGMGSYTSLVPIGNGFAAIGSAFIGGCCSNAAIATSPDGLNWSEEILETGDLIRGTITGIAQIGNFYLATETSTINNSQELAMSPDGLVWCELQGYPASVKPSGVVVNGGQVVTFTTDGTIVSTPPSSNTDVALSCLDAESSGPVTGNVSISSGGSGTTSGSGGGTTSNPGGGASSTPTSSGGGGGEGLLALAGLLALRRGQLRHWRQVSR